MGCAPCAQKRAARQALLNPGAAAPSAGPTSRIAVYEVVKDGDVVTATTSATAARQEARRLGGSLRVTSREAGQQELQEAGLGGPPD